MNSIENFLVEETDERGEVRTIINKEVTLFFINRQESVQFLVELISYWQEKQDVFCFCSTKTFVEDLPRRKWVFGYKNPSTCRSCVTAQEMLDKIFGSREVFNDLFFVRSLGDRKYIFHFDHLRRYARYGPNALATYLLKSNFKYKDYYF